MSQNLIQLFKPHVSPEAVLAVSDILRSGWIGLGPKTAEFEQRFAEYVGAKHAVAMNSATAALHLALATAGIGEGDEVLTTPLTFVSTNEAILYQRATPVFVDVDEATLLIDLDKAARMLSRRTKAIIVVHYGGNPAHMGRVSEFAARHGLRVIEDAAHACGATYAPEVGCGPRRVGGHGSGSLACFSFHAVKNLVAGDGGMVTTDDDAERDRLVKLRWMGIDKSTFSRMAGGYQWEYGVDSLGYKCHMNDINAAMALAHLDRLDEWNSRRRAIAARYREEINAKFVKVTPGAQSANHLCVVRVPQRDEVISRLRLTDIEAGVHYRPNHLHGLFKECPRGDLSASERAYGEIMSLPLHLGLSDEDVGSVCRELNKILASL